MGCRKESGPGLLVNYLAGKLRTTRIQIGIESLALKFDGLVCMQRHVHTQRIHGCFRYDSPCRESNSGRRVVSQVL